MKAHGLTREVALEPVPDTLSAAAASPLPECAATSRGAVRDETVAKNSSIRPVTSTPHSPGRFPRFLGEYKILEEIARGGMGVVYRARQDKLNRLVAVKLIRAGSLAGTDDLRRFRHEAAAIADLDHPHIIPIYEIGQEDDQPYFSMKLVEGGNLARHVPRLKNDPRTAAALVAKVARAVHYAHQRMILHRDIKPSNILLDVLDEPYVTDFGLAKRIGPDSGTTATATVTGAVMGTPAYMPPEQALGTKSVTTAADVYSLGATLYEVLTGQPPFSGDSAGEILRQVLDHEPAPPLSLNPELDRDLGTICLKCLEKETARRYGSAEALAEDLDRWLAGKPITARPVPMWEKAVKWVKRRRAIAALVILLLLALLSLFGGGIWFTLQLWKERDLANRGRYAADMNLARRALDDGLIYQVREQLKAYQAGPRALADLRGFEWYYLANLCDRTPIRLRGHQKAVICVAFHPDGSRVVSGGEDGTVRIWDLTARDTIHTFPVKGGTVHCVAVSPDGRWMAAGDAAGGLRLWAIETRAARALPGHEKGLRSVAFSPDSRHLLSCDAGGLIVQWDVSTVGREFELRHRHEHNGVPALSGRTQAELMQSIIATYTPDGRTIISAGQDQWVMIWDVATRRLRDHVQAANNVYGFSIRPGGREVALAKQLGLIEILDLDKPHAPRRSLRSTNSRHTTVAFSPRAPTFAVGGVGVAKLLDVQTGQILDQFGQANNSPFSLAFEPGGRSLALAVGAEIQVVSQARSLQGTTIATSLGSIRRLAASRDERLLALGREDGKIVVWDVRAERILQTLSGHDPKVFDVAFVPGTDGARLASVGGDAMIRIWDANAGGKPLFSRSVGTGAVYAVAVRPDGRQIAAGGEDGMVRTWDPATGQADLPPLEHGASISALAYDASGMSMASGGMDRMVRVWSSSSGRRRSGPLAHPHQITSMAFSPDGRLLAGGGGRAELGGGILIWNASSGKISATVDCPRGVDCLSFSPDSRRIATCGADNVVQVWDATGGHETLSLTGHADRASAIGFAARGMRLYSAGHDGVVKLWDGSAAVSGDQ
jgi:WD40 repeat protein